MTGLGINRRSVGGSTVLTLTGDLDLDTAVEFREFVDRMPLVTNEKVVIDMAGVGFCDSSGIAALFAARNHALAAQAELALAAVPHHILRTLRLIGLEPVFALLPTVED